MIGSRATVLRIHPPAQTLVAEVMRNNRRNPAMSGPLAAITRPTIGELLERLPGRGVPSPTTAVLMPALNWARATGIEQGLAPMLRRVWDRLELDFLPSNWPGVGDVDGIEDMLHVMRAGMPLVWVPPADVVQELLDAEEGEIRDVLFDHRATVLQSCRECLDEVEREDLAYCAELLQECVDVAESGSWSAAQSLAASVWDTLIRGIARHSAGLRKHTRRYGPVFNYRTFRDNLPQYSGDTLMGKVRAVCVLAPIPAALADFHGGQIPETYSRHATAHAASPRQYTPANSIIALMLAVSLIREMEASRWRCTIDTGDQA